jgi:hypothetical protein
MNMSTNGMTSWAVDLKDVGAIYPFQGTETLLVILGLAFWIGWHIWQIRHENAELEREKNKAKGEALRKAIERY